MCYHFDRAPRICLTRWCLEQTFLIDGQSHPHLIHLQQSYNNMMPYLPKHNLRKRDRQLARLAPRSFINSDK